MNYRIIIKDFLSFIDLTPFEVFLYCYLSGIIIFLLYQLYWLKKNVKDVNSDIKYASRHLPDEKTENSRVVFADQWQTINGGLMQNKTMKHHWHEFKETIIRPSSHIGCSKNYKNSVLPELFFNFDRIVGEKINLRAVDSLPGKFVGLGILGTFIGLTVGISIATKQSDGFTNTAELQNAISYLLRGAGFAFSTSVVGIFASLIFSFLDNISMKKIDKSISEFNRKLEACLECITTENILDRSHDELEKQTKYLSEFNENIVAAVGDVLSEKMEKSISPSFKELIEAVNSLKEVQVKASQSFYKDMADKMSGGLSTFASDQMSGLKDVFEQLNTGLPTLLNLMTSTQQDAYKQNNTLINQFNENMANAQEKLTNSIIENSQNLKNEIGGIGSALIDETHSMQNKAMQAMVDNITNLTKNFENIESTSNRRQSEFFDKISDSISLTDKNNEKFQNVISSMSNIVKDFSEVELAQKNISNSNSETMKEISHISNSLKGFSEAMLTANSKTEKIANNLNMFAQVIDNNIKKTKEINENLVNQWSQYEQRFDKIDTSTKNWFEQIDSGLKDYGKNTNDHLLRIKEGTQQVANSFAQAAEDFKETLENLEEILEDVNKKGK